jgi:hypothetical protein
LDGADDVVNLIGGCVENALIDEKTAARPVTSCCRAAAGFSGTVLRT